MITKDDQFGHFVALGKSLPESSWCLASSKGTIKTQAQPNRRVEKNQCKEVALWEVKGKEEEAVIILRNPVTFQRALFHAHLLVSNPATLSVKVNLSMCRKIALYCPLVLDSSTSLSLKTIKVSSSSPLYFLLPTLQRAKHSQILCPHIRKQQDYF